MISTALLVLFPDANPEVDYEVRDFSDGNGPKITAWRLPAPIPTQAELQAAAATAANSRKAIDDIEAIEKTQGIGRGLREAILRHGSFAALKAALQQDEDAVTAKRAAIVRGADRRR